MAAITTTGTLTAGNSRTFALAPGSALTLTLLPNCRVTVTETPETVSASDAGGNSPRVHNHQLAGVFTYGPYAMGGSVVVDNASNSGSTVTWGRKDTAVTTSSDGLSLVSGDRNFPLNPVSPRLGQSMLILGDSFAFQTNGGAGPSGLTFTRASDVVTVTGATSHIFYPGALLSAVGLADVADEVQFVPATYISSSSFSYPSAGADGVIAQRSSGSGAVIMHHAYQSAGFWSHWNRLTAGAYTLVNNAGFPGATTDVIAAKVATHVAPYSPQRVVYFAGYNDLTAARTVAETVASIKAAVDAYPGALWDIFSTAPFNSAAANNTAANLRLLTRYYTELKIAFADYHNVRVHNTLALWGLSTGLAKTGYINTGDNIHPGPRAMYEAAKYLLALDVKAQTGIQLPYTTLDTRTADAASRCLLDNPLMGTSVASTLTNVTGNMPTGGSGALTGTSASGVSSIASRSDGFGSDWVVTYTPANADNVLRMSFSGLQARFVSGGTIESIVMKVSVSGVVAGKIKQMQMGMVWIADGVTYASSSFESTGSSSTIDHIQQEDVVDLVFSMRNVKVPTFASLTTARLDFTIQHSAAGTEVVAKIAQAQITLAA